MSRSRIYTDGSCNNNTPSPGGWGIVFYHPLKYLELSGCEREVTTSSRMELLAVIKALEALRPPARVDIHTDSEYVIKMAHGARIRKNRDLVESMRKQIARHNVQNVQNVRFVKVPAHSGDELNERADELAGAARKAAEAEVLSWEEERLSAPVEAQDRFRDWFDCPTRRLYPWIRKRGEAYPPKVRTPRGIGVLENVLSGDAQVSLDGERETGQYKTGKPYLVMRTFKVEEIDPIPFTSTEQAVA